MANCQACGAPITWAVVGRDGVGLGDGERVPLDQALAQEGEGRYGMIGTRVEGGQSIPVVIPAVKDFAGEAYRDHREVCVAGQVRPA